jgi:hypothetical protein
MEERIFILFFVNFYGRDYLDGTGLDRTLILKMAVCVKL